jgi:hypothetical protein
VLAAAAGRGCHRPFKWQSIAYRRGSSGKAQVAFNRLRSIEGPVPKISGTSQGPFRRPPNLSYWRELPIPHGGRLPRSMDSRQTELLCVSGDAACAALSPGGVVTLAVLPWMLKYQIYERSKAFRYGGAGSSPRLARGLS